MVDEADAAVSCRIVTWNVNGLKAAARRFGSVQRLLESLQGDIVCLQETKVRQGDLERELALVDGWHSFFSCFRGKTGYSGVATFCRTAVTVPVAASEGLTGCLQPAAAPVLDDDSSHLEALLPRERLQQLDSEGRAVVTDHGAFVLVNLYGPALTSEEAAEERMAFKLDFYKVLEAQVRRLHAEGRIVVVVGDLNISPQPLDICRPKEMNLTRPDRVWLNRLLPGGSGELVDVFRTFHPTREGAFTCWSTATGARVHNYGSRIDHILASAARAPAASPCPPWFRACDIWPEFQGSDHAPVWADVTPPSPMPRSNEPPPLCTLHAFKGRQGSLRSWLGSAQQPQEGAVAADCSGGSTAAGTSAAANGTTVEGAWQGGAIVGPAATAAAVAAASATGWRPADRPPTKRRAAARPGLPSTGKQAPPNKKPRPAGQTSLLSFVSRPAPSTSQRAAPPPAPEPSTSSGSLPTPCSSTQQSSAGGPASAPGCASRPAQHLCSNPLPASLALQAQQQQPLAARGRPSQQPFDPSPSHNSNRPTLNVPDPQPPLPDQASHPSSAPRADPTHLPPAPSPPFEPQPPLQAQDARAARFSQQDDVQRAVPWPAAKPLAPAPLPPDAKDAWLDMPAMQIVCSQYRASGSLPHPHHRVPHDDSTVEACLASCSGTVRSRDCDMVEGSARTGISSIGSHGVTAEAAVADSAAPAAALVWPAEGAGGDGPRPGVLHQPLMRQVDERDWAGPPWEAAAAGYGQAATQAGWEAAGAGDGYAATQAGREAAGAGDGYAATQAGQAAAAATADNQAAAHTGREAAADAWRRIAQVMRPPCCGGHKEPCAVRTVKKRGPNQGRQFYVCARPDGPPPVGRCDHFEWAGRRAPKKPVW